jgi:hypothetical protein
MATKKTVKQVKVTELDPVFDNLEFTRRADELIGVIQRHFRMIEGRNVESPEIEEIANNIIKGRLK